jgi:hypothetical protein
VLAAIPDECSLEASVHETVGDDEPRDDDRY